MTRPVSEVSEVSDFRSPSHARTRFAIEKKIELGTVGREWRITDITDFTDARRAYAPRINPVLVGGSWAAWDPHTGHGGLGAFMGRETSQVCPQGHWRS